MPAVVPIILGGGIAAQLIGLGVSFAASFGLSYYQKRRVKKLQRRQGQGRSDIQQNFRQATMPRYYVFGLARIGGLLAQAESVGDKMYVVPIVSDDQITKIEAFYVRNIEVLTSLSGGIYTVTTPPFNTAAGSYIKFEVRFGNTDQAASTILRNAFPTAYLATDNGAGISYIVAEITQPPSEKFQTVMGGNVPEIAALVRGARVYDSRVVGADINNTATWVESTNPALHVLRFLISANGMGLNPAVFDIDSFAEVANWCDELVSTKTKGLRKRYECGGAISYDTLPADVIDDMLETFAGDFYISEGGRISLSCDDLDTPTITITKEMVVEITADRHIGALYESTSVKSRFSSEDHGYAESQEEADQWDDAAAIESVGRVIPADHDLPYVFRHDQARRLMKRKWYALNPEWKIDMVLDFNGLELLGERVFRFEYEIFGISGTFRIETLEAKDQLSRVSVRAVSVSEASKQWNHLTEEGTAPAIPVATSSDGTPLAPTGLAGIFTDNKAYFRWNPLATGKTAEAQYKLNTDPNWISVTPNPTKNYTSISGLTTNSDYDFRVRSSDPEIGVSAWASITFNASGAGIVAGALQSLTATGGVIKITAIAQQSTEAFSTEIQFVAMPSGQTANWSLATQVPVFPGEVGSADITVTNAGTYDVYARSVAADGTFGAISGPVSAVATAQVSFGGSSGSDYGSSGQTVNSNYHPLYDGSGGYHPLYGGDGSSDGSYGGGGLY